MTYPILITRAQKKSEQFRDQLLRAGLLIEDIFISPVTDIVFTGVAIPADGDLVFTSGNAVIAIDPSQISGRTSYCVGQRTTAVAQSLGANAVYAGPTARALGAFLAQQRPNHLVYPRGASITMDLKGALGAVGVQVEEVIVYKQQSLSLRAAAFDLLNRETPVVLPLFSSLSATYLLDQINSPARHIAICISMPVAALCRDNGLQNVHVANEPNARSMVESVVKSKIGLGC